VKTYTLHLSRNALPQDEEVLEKAELVEDGFSWGAFFFTALWCFWHRLWLAGLGVLVAFVLLDALLVALHVRPGMAVLATLLMMSLVGLEASSLRRWTLERRGRPAVDAVSADDLAEAERKSFGRWLAQGFAAPSSVSPVAPYRTPDAVLGFFPEADRRP
jgi:uncharacterized protein DUF2628